jgi:hypothetical protein
MPYISESSLQKSFSRCLRKILCRLQPREVGSHVSVWTAQSCVRTPISVKKPNSSRLHTSGRHGNTSRRTSKSEKIPTFLCRYGVGRQLEPVRTSRQRRLDAEFLDKEIACIHSASVQKIDQHRPDAILLCQLRVDKVQPSEL